MAGPVTCLSCLTRATASSRLPAHQREVLVAIALSDAPIDVLAERLNTTRGALYKTLHDARHNQGRSGGPGTWHRSGRAGEEP